MLPLVLDGAGWRVLLAGGGAALRRRLALVEAAGCDLLVYAPCPDPALRETAGGRLVARLPDAAEIAAARVLLVAGLPLAQAIPLARIARAHRVLVNVEDERAWCDFHVPSIIRRGDLLLGISTGGRSPALAGWLRAGLARLIGPEWAGRLDEVAGVRDQARTGGAAPAQVLALTSAFIAERGWSLTGRVCRGNGCLP